MLELAKDWLPKVDIHEKLVIPEDIVKTKQWPDIVIFSRSKKTVVMVELTVPLEKLHEDWSAETFKDPRLTDDEDDLYSIIHCYVTQTVKHPGL